MKILMKRMWYRWCLMQNNASRDLLHAQYRKELRDLDQSDKELNTKIAQLELDSARNVIQQATRRTA